VCRKSKPRATVARICQWCNGPYTIKRSEDYKSKYCSRRCHNRANVSARYKDTVYTFFNCVGCGKRKRCSPGRLPTIQYCSHVCRQKRVPYICIECGKEGVCVACQVPRKKFCSRTCRSIHIARTACLVSPTSIEIETYQALTALGVEFIPQHRIGKYVTDAFIPAANVVVECQGDYWHCNPKIYSDGPINERQVKQVNKDARRMADLRARGYQVVELWESEIKSTGAKSLLQSALGL
jgi:very-short-patch-repair endonuclease